ncbi:hypothetical protein GYMLUDRAFT_180392, partial [Collybiopsis luxurians FD-317 M1]
LPKRRGYPLWNPRPVGWQIPDAYRASGVSIGDIGIMNEFGEFDYLFNIGLPANDPVNSRRVPPDFIPLPGVRDNLAVTGSEQDPDLRPGSYIASNHAYFRTQHIAGYPQIPQAPKEVGAGLKFTTSASAGALLVLPEGGTSYDHPAPTMFLEHATRCAASWFNFINQILRRGVNEIYLVTGCDKTRAWGVACFSGASPRNVLLEYVPKLPRIAGKKPEYLFRRSDSAYSEAGSDVIFEAGSDVIFERQSGCVFIRGFRITSRAGPQSREKISTIWRRDGTTRTSKKKDGSYWKYYPSDIINEWILGKVFFRSFQFPTSS